jgi:TRAP-type C4-dicarboxylate transport system permease small subunit
MFVLLVDVGIQILSRYISFIPRFLWTVDVVNMTLTWVILLGSAVGVREGRHFFIDVLPQNLNRSAEIVLRIIYYFFMFSVTAVYVGYGYQFLLMGYVQTSPTIGLNLAWVYASVPVAGISWALFLVENVYDEFSQAKQPPRPEEIEGEFPT